MDDGSYTAAAGITPGRATLARPPPTMQDPATLAHRVIE
jgi:hypothetical protein